MEFRKNPNWEVTYINKFNNITLQINELSHQPTLPDLLVSWHGGIVLSLCVLIFPSVGGDEGMDRQMLLAFARHWGDGGNSGCFLSRVLILKRSI